MSGMNGVGGVSGVGWTSGGPSVAPAHVVFVAPHPDDEVLGYAGLLRWCLDRGSRCEIVAVTDGEASHPASRMVDPATLVGWRVAERCRALAVLGAAEVPVTRLGLPDGACAGAAEGVLAAALAARVGPGSCLVVPWRHDGHPDHEAVARAGAAVASTAGPALWEVPIWGRVGGVSERCSVLGLGRFLARKREAMAAFRSQLVALGPDPADGPVIHPDELEALVQGTELVVIRER